MCQYVVVDLEMCNVAKMYRTQYPYSREIIQIGAVLLDEEYNIIDSFKTYVKPQYGRLTTFINKLTGISNYNLMEAPAFDKAISEFMNWIPDEDVKLVSWSMSDEIQLRKECKFKNITLSNLDEISENWLDAQFMFSEKLEASKIFRLKDALIATDISVSDQEHDALADAENTAMLFAKIQKEAKLTLNTYFEKAVNEVDTAFGFSMMDALAGIQGCVPISA